MKESGGRARDCSYRFNRNYAEGIFIFSRYRHRHVMVVEVHKHRLAIGWFMELLAARLLFMVVDFIRFNMKQKQMRECDKHTHTHMSI